MQAEDVADKGDEDEEPNTNNISHAIKKQMDENPLIQQQYGRNLTDIHQNNAFSQQFNRESFGVANNSKPGTFGKCSVEKIDDGQ